MESITVEYLTTSNGEDLKWDKKIEYFDTPTDFSIDEDSLNTEICRIGQLMVKYGDLAARMNANLKRKEENVKYIHSKVASMRRSSAEATGEKMTEGKLSEYVTVDDLYQQALLELHIMRADALRADHWWRSITKKADMLNALAFRQNAEIKRMPG